jgi:hypothetical protein
MNHERRKVVGKIFADSSTYALTVGIIGSILSGQFNLLFVIGIAITFIILTIAAYSITPQDKEE